MLSSARVGSGSRIPVDPTLAPPVTPVTRPGAAPIGTASPVSLGTHLEYPEALRRFSGALQELGRGTRNQPVRIAQFGDSHTACDIESGTVRQLLQARFGDGGRGFVPLGKPYRGFSTDGVRTSMSREWHGERGTFRRGVFTGDGLYGPSGLSIETSRPHARATAELLRPSSEIEVLYLAQPRGGSFDVYIDDVSQGRVTTKGRTTTSAFRAFSVADGPHRVEVRSVGDGPVRIFGLHAERSPSGIVLDNYGINGARVTTPLTWNEAHMTEQLRHRAPDLVVIAYGTNEAGDDTPLDTYERRLVDLLGRVARAVPSASCLLLGPPDRSMKNELGEWTTPQRLLDLIDVQRRVASAGGCAFYNQWKAMGGLGAMEAWATETPPRAQRDRVHLTRLGYTELGTAFFRELTFDLGKEPSAARP